MTPRSRPPTNSALFIGVSAVLVGAVLVYVYMMQSNDEGKDYRKDNPDGFQPGETPIDELSDLQLVEDQKDRNAKNDSQQNSKDQGTKKLSLADLIISDSTEANKKEQMDPAMLSLPPPIPSRSSLPRSVTKSYILDGVSTDMFVQIFADRIVVGVSQLNGKFGNYMMCQAIPDEVNPKHVDYEVTTLLGAREDTMLPVYARQVTERIEKLQANPTALTVIIATSLDKKKALQPEMFKSIVELLVNLYRQSIGS